MPSASVAVSCPVAPVKASSVTAPMVVPVTTARSSTPVSWIVSVACALPPAPSLTV